MSAAYKIQLKRDKFDITNIENYEVEIDVDEIWKKAFKSNFKDSLELAAKLLEGQEETIDFQKKIKKLTQEIFETEGM